MRGVYFEKDRSAAFWEIIRGENTVSGGEGIWKEDGIGKERA